MSRIWMLGDNVNTDVIIPGRYNVTTDRAQLARYCLCEVLPEFAQHVQAGDVVMARHNLCCCSSRAHAPAALQTCHMPAIISPRFRRLFYRQTVNTCPPVPVCADAGQGTSERPAFRVG